MDLLESESESKWDEVACLEPCSGPQGPQCSGLFGTAQGEWPVWDSLDSDSEISVISLCSEECRLASSELRLDGRFCRFCDCWKGRHYREFFDALPPLEGRHYRQFLDGVPRFQGRHYRGFFGSGFDCEGRH